MSELQLKGTRWQRNLLWGVRRNRLPRWEVLVHLDQTERGGALASQKTARGWSRYAATATVRGGMPCEAFCAAEWQSALAVGLCWQPCKLWPPTTQSLLSTNNAFAPKMPKLLFVLSGILTPCFPTPSSSPRLSPALSSLLVFFHSLGCQELNDTAEQTGCHGNKLVIGQGDWSRVQSDCGWGRVALACSPAWLGGWVLEGQRVTHLYKKNMYKILKKKTRKKTPPDAKPWHQRFASLPLTILSAGLGLCITCFRLDKGCSSPAGKPRSVQTSKTLSPNSCIAAYFKGRGHNTISINRYRRRVKSYYKNIH